MQWPLKRILVPRDEWHPFPTADNREPWEALPKATRLGHVERGETAIETEWPRLPATVYLNQFRALGSVETQAAFRGTHRARRAILSDLAIAECVEGSGRFTDPLINAAWGICEESAWCHPAHIGVIGGDQLGEEYDGRLLPDVDDPTIARLSARTGAVLAWVIYLLGDRLDGVSPEVRRRVRRELELRILNPYLERDWKWMHFKNNWNTMPNMNCLTVVLLMERDEERRAAMVHKGLTIMDRFITGYPTDGSCVEGPGYWSGAGGCLFDTLEMLHSATDGRFDVYDDARVQDIGRFIYRAHIAGDYFVSKSDCAPRLRIAGDMVCRFGRRIGDGALEQLGAWAVATQYAEKPCPGGLSDRALHALFGVAEMSAVPAPRAPLRHLVREHRVP